MSSPAAIFNKDVEISGNSDLIIKSGGKLGIGVTNPSSQLDVIGSGNFSGDLNVDGSFNIGSITDVETYVNDISTNLSNLSQNKIENGNSNVTVNSSGGSITFDTSGSQRMIIKDDGDVSFSGNLYGDGSNLTGTADDFTAGKAKDLYTSGISNAINAVPYINGSGDTILNSNSLKFDGNNIIVKDNNGSASIGLTINDSGGNANLAFNHVNKIPDKNGNAGRIECNVDSTSGTALMHFELKPAVSADVSINLDNLLTLKHDGTNKHVGIGTINPSKELDVNGDGNFSGDLTVDGTITATEISGNGSGLTNLNADNINSGTLVVSRGGTGSTSASGARTNLQLGTTNSVQFAKLALGRTPNNSTLTISGDQYIEGYNTNNPSTETQYGLERGIFKLNLMTPVYAASDVDPSGDFLQIRRAGSSNIWQGKAIMNISNVTGKSHLTKLGFKLQSHPNGRELDGTPLYQQLYTIPCVMTGENRVGIGGTTNPSVELDVSGDGNFTGDLDVDGSLNIGSITDVETYVNDISSNLSNLSQDKIENGNSNVTVETSNGPISFDTAGTEKMRILTNGNVGIGKPDPSLELDVSGSIKISGSQQQLMTNIIRASYDGDTFIENKYQSIRIFPNNQVIIKKKDGDGGNTMIIDCNNKRVGIGKLPSIEFDVSGDVSFSGNLDVGGTLTASDFSGNGSGLTNLSAAKISTGTLALARGGTGATSVLDARTNLHLGTTNSVQFARLGLGKASDSNFRLDTNGAMRVRANPINRAQANGPERGVLLLHSSAGLGSNTEGGNSNFLIEPSGNILTLSRDGGSSVSYPLGCILNLSRWEASGNNSRSRLAFRLNHAGGQGDNESDYNTAMVICSNNSVGIGVTNPSTEFDVSGDVSFSGNLNVEGQIKTDTITISGGDMNIKTNTSHHIIFSTNNTETLRIKRNGNVGIGTHNPSKKLEVVGDVSFSGNLDVGGNLDVAGTMTSGSFSGNGASLTNLNADNISSGTLTVNRGGTGASSASAARTNLQLGTSNDVQFMRIGLGTTSDSSYSLNASDSIQSKENLVLRNNGSNDVSDANSILFQNSGSHYNWRIGRIYDSSRDFNNTGSLIISGGNTNNDYSQLTDRLTISSNGNIGIGTTNPSKKLEVVGDVSFSGDLDVGGSLNIGSITNVETFVNDISTNLSNLSQDKIENGNSNVTVNSSGGSITFDTAGSQRMIIKNDGDISFSGILNVTDTIIFGSTSRQMINLFGTKFGIGVESASTYFRSDNNFRWYKGGTHSASSAGGTKLMDLDTNGNLVISGTITASDFSGNAASATALETARTIGGVTFDGTSDITPIYIDITTDSDDATHNLLFADGTTGTQRPKTNSNITVNPSTGTLSAKELSIVNSNHTFNTVDFNDNGNYTGLTLLKDNGSGNSWGYRIGGGLLSNSGSTLVISRKSIATSDTYTESLRIDKNGNVGIGTTNPSKKLEVVGDVSFSGDLDVGGSLNIGSITDVETFVNDISSNLSNLSNLSQDKIENGNSNVIVNSSGGSISFDTAGSQRMIIKNDGDVSFSGDLDVGGSLNIGSITNVETFVNDISTNLSNLSQDKIENGNSNVIVNSSGGSITFDTSGSQRMIIKNDGDVSFSGELNVEGNVKIGLDTEVFVTRFSSILAPFDYTEMTQTGPIRARILQFNNDTNELTPYNNLGSGDIRNDRLVGDCYYMDSNNTNQAIHFNYGVSYEYFQNNIDVSVNPQTMRNSDTSGNLGHDGSGNFVGRHENVFMTNNTVVPGASVDTGESYNLSTMNDHITLISSNSLDDRVYVDKMNGYGTRFATYMELKYDVSFISTYFGDPSGNKSLNYESVFGGEQGNSISDNHIYTVHIQCIYENIGKVTSNNGGIDNTNGTDKERIRLELLDSSENYISTYSYEDLDFSRNSNTGVSDTRNIDIDVSGSALKDIKYIRFSYKSIVVNDEDGLPDQLATHKIRGLNGKAFISRHFLITDKTISDSLVETSNTINNRVKFNADINLNSFVGIGIENPEFPLHVVNSRNMMNHMITPYIDQSPSSSSFNHTIYGDIGSSNLNLGILRPFDNAGNFDLWSGMSSYNSIANPDATYNDQWQYNDDTPTDNINLDLTAPAGISIYSYGAVYTKFQFITASDSRIKKNRTDISNNEALEILRKLKPCKYNYIDNTNRDNTSVYGFMAQEVKSVLNNSTKITQEYIPNIYQKCLYDREENTLEFFLPVDIKFDEDGIAHLRISNYINDNFIGFTDVKCTGTIGNNIYTIEPPSSPIYSFSISDLSGNFIYENDESNIIHNFTFCFGQRVDDFHSLNKSAIWTITTAATQEIDNQLVDAKTQIETQKTQIETQKTQIETLTNLIASLTQRVELLEQN